MSKQLRLIALISIIFLSNVFSQDIQYTLKVEAEELANEEIWLYEYFGYGLIAIEKNKVRLNDKGEGRLDSIAHAGIYVLGKKDDPIYEFMIGEPGTYVIKQERGRWTAQGSPETEAYAVFTDFSSKTDKMIDSLRQAKDAEGKNKAGIRKLQAKTDSLVNRLATEQADNLAGHYFNALRPVQPPNFKLLYPELSDSALWIKSLEYYRAHFPDNIAWGDSTMQYTPIIYEQLTTYMKKIVEQTPEGLVSAIDNLMQMSVHPKLKWLVFFSISNNLSTAVPAEEYAYIYLVENYLLKQKPGWASDDFITEQKNKITPLKPAALGSIAPDIILPDMNGNECRLSDLSADAIIIFFWDFSCPRCRSILSQFSEVVDRFSFKNIKVYTVYVGDDKAVWDAWVVKKLDARWTNTYLNGKDDILRTYRVGYSPKFYLLDKDHEIIDKNFTIGQLYNFLLDMPY